MKKKTTVFFFWNLGTEVTGSKSMAAIRERKSRNQKTLMEKKKQNMDDFISFFEMIYKIGDHEEIRYEAAWYQWMKIVKIMISSGEKSSLIDDIRKYTFIQYTNLSDSWRVNYQVLCEKYFPSSADCLEWNSRKTVSTIAVCSDFTMIKKIHVQFRDVFWFFSFVSDATWSNRESSSGILYLVLRYKSHQKLSYEILVNDYLLSD